MFITDSVNKLIADSVNKYVAFFHRYFPYSNELFLLERNDLSDRFFLPETCFVSNTFKAMSLSVPIK